MDDKRLSQPHDSAPYGQRRRPHPGGAGRRNFSRDAQAPGPRVERVRPAATAIPEPDSAKHAHELLDHILVRMGIVDAKIMYYERPEGEYFEVQGADLANLIGRHGQTLEALNQIFNNILNTGLRKDRHYFTIDAEGYRARRADNLRSTALQALERALRERRPIELEPMHPAERKIIHLALEGNEFVTTESAGVEPERRIVVIPKPL
jgi:spoIIIJ-associated protein